MHNRTAFLLTFASVLTTFVPPMAWSGDNPQITFPLHAAIGLYQPCDGYLPVDCYGNRPVTEVPASSNIVIFWFAANYSNLTGVQTAFAWDPSWSLIFGLWGDCLMPGPGPDVVPQNPGGPVLGSISLALNCLTGPGIRPLARMTFMTGQNGCLYQVESAFPFGICAIDCSGAIDRIDPVREPLRLGRICVGATQQDACDPPVPAVNATTWGRVKRTY